MSTFDITCAIEGQFCITFPANGEAPEMLSQRPDGVYLQGIKSKIRHVRQGKVDKSQGRSSFCVLAGGNLFVSQPGPGEDQPASQKGYLEQHVRTKLAPLAQKYKDSGHAPNVAALGAVAASPDFQWSDTEPDSDHELDHDAETRENVETPANESFLTTAFYGYLPHHRAKATRIMPARKAKTKRRMCA
ncbi:hypothetical protein LTR56_028119 [Elasticomyces elasticus]|nr:hypothetical protein LTR56_028119 [Elasticomyces elasticus]KAK5711508.1 hypothetical protein LTS12_027941 [Elasticomyces elasticus]